VCLITIKIQYVQNKEVQFRDIENG